jgi:YaiO family outer membrane protein
MIGLAEIASWQGEYARSVSLYDRAAEQYPDNAELAFQLGRVHFWSGNYEKARHSYEKALRLDPQNKEYRKALTTASPRWLKNYEFRYEHQAETFTDGRNPYIDRRLAFQLNFLLTGPLVLKASLTERSEKKDYQYEVESYPRLWNRSYAYLNLAVSPKAVHYPNHSWLAEVYQGIFSSWEVSLGHRRITFSPRSTSVYLGSVAHYHDQSIAFLRWYLTREEGKTTFSWTVNLRRYFSETSHLSVGYGMGSKPFDIVTAEDLLVKESWVIFAGLDWRFFQKIRLQLYYHLRDEGTLRRHTFLLCTGYCW